MAGDGESVHPPDIVLDHVTITVADLAASQAWYDAVVAPLGLIRLVDFRDPEDADEVADEAIGYGHAGGAVAFWLVVGGRPTRSLHLALRAPSRTEVEQFFTAAVVVGSPVHAPPRPWLLYRRGRFSATVVDPDGNLIEAVALEA
jgi:catechol 2,3-dioxygenase-like lactoylglutathione lyase family enzyme